MKLPKLHSLLFIAFACSFSLLGYGQSKRANIWYFGRNAGILFDKSTPVALSNGAINTIEGCAVICNENGQLKFYTDGSNVYNSKHILMPNGSGLNGDPSSTQSGIIVPNPSKKHIFYVFSSPGLNSLYYSIVDTTLDGGLGDVSIKNVELMSNGTEKLSAIKHFNGVDTWVISHQSENNHFYSYRVTSLGVNPVPVVSSVGSQFKHRSTGYLKFSPKGDKIVSADYLGKVEIFDFDNQTGKVSNAQILINSTTHYGVEFSPSGKYVYITKSLTNSDQLYQFDLTAGDISAIKSSKVVIGKNFVKKAGALQLGPDGRIYMAFWDYSSHLGVINEPENKGQACKFVKNGFSLWPRFSSWGLPSFNQSFFYKPNNVDCKYTPVICGSLGVEVFNVGDTQAILSSKWDFGDGTQDSGIRLNKIYTKHGEYNIINWVVLNDYGNIVTKKFELKVKTKPKPVVNISINDTFQCLNNHQFEFVNNSDVDGGGVIDSFRWHFSDGTIEYTASPQPKLFKSYGVYTVKVIMETDKGCKDSFEQKLYVGNIPKPDFEAKGVCVGNSVSFNNKTKKDSIKSWYWDFGDGSSSISHSPSHLYNSVGGYEVILAAETQAGCKDSLVKFFPHLVSPIPKAYFKENVMDNVEELKLGFTNHSSNGDNYLWNFGDGTSSTSFSPDKVYNDSGTYIVVLTAISKWSCVDSFSKPIKVFYSRPIFIPSAFTPNGDGLNNTFGIETLAGIKELNMEIFNRWGEKIFQSKSLATRWDGTYKGTPVPDGSYLYLIRIRDFANKIKIYKGTITLVR